MATSSKPTAAVDPGVAIAHKFPEVSFDYDERDVALYALGVRAPSMTRSSTSCTKEMGSHTLSEVRVEGSETMGYLDNLKATQRFTEQGDAIVFESEIDKVYPGAPSKIAIIDHEKKKTFVVTKEGLPDAVVWNPWDKKAKAMQDFGDVEYKNILCVEPAAVEKPLTLKPGEEWKGRLALSAVLSSYCSGQLDPLKVLRG